MCALSFRQFRSQPLHLPASPSYLHHPLPIYVDQTRPNRAMKQLNMKDKLLTPSLHVLNFVTPGCRKENPETKLDLRGPLFSMNPHEEVALILPEISVVRACTFPFSVSWWCSSLRGFGLAQFDPPDFPLSDGAPLRRVCVELCASVVHKICGRDSGRGGVDLCGGFFAARALTPERGSLQFSSQRWGINSEGTGLIVRAWSWCGGC